MDEKISLIPVARPESLNQISTAVLNSEAYRRELLQRILRSSGFARSERLGALLTYVCEMSFKGKAELLNEQRIGCSVFGRAEDYDSSIDGIVRSQASRLRQRLDQYFELEGIDEVVRIDIPRGGYAPRFIEKESPLPPCRSDPEDTTVVAPKPAQALEPDSASKARGASFFVMLAFIAGILVSLLAFGMGRHRLPVPESAAPEDAVERRFWSTIFTPGHPTSIVTPDSGLVMYENFSGTQIDLKSYLDGEYRAVRNKDAAHESALMANDVVTDLANRRYTSIVDVKAILQMKDRARAMSSNVQLRFARDLRPNDFKEGNVVLLGASSANPWLELFEREMNFVIRDDYTRERAVLNRNPHPGEPARWEFRQGNPGREVFGIVALRPNLDGNGNALLLEGTSMSGTEAAVDFVADASQFLPFLRQIAATQDRTPYFEVLLTTNSLGASAAHPRIVAWRRTP